MKNIVVCSDGTGNTAIKGRGTNVFKLFEAVDLTGHRSDESLTPQVALYDDGVGTQNFKLLKIFAGMTGYGLSRNVKQLYKEIVRVYDPGDRLFLFGFSRGAFTVRSLAGFIATCGLLDPAKFPTAHDLDVGVARAYGAYRKCYRTWFAEKILGEPDRRATTAFRQQCARPEGTRVWFIGVWDTVDAVGLPFHVADVINTVAYRFKFPDRKLSPMVDHAYHALAIDDERHSFHPLLWNETEETNGRIQQVWFAGAHSNVGGGYEKQGMSLVPLDWMMSAAERAELRFHPADRRFYREHANVDDTLYDPRAGFGIFYRWKVRDLAVICANNGVVPRIHSSVLERVAHGTDDYAPGNIPPNASVVVTPPPAENERPLLERRARNMEHVLRNAHDGGLSLLERVPTSIVIGRLSYYVYLVALVVAVLAGAQESGLAGFVSPLATVSAVGRMAFGLMTSPLTTAVTLAERVAVDLGLLSWLIGGLVIAYVMAFWADWTMSGVFSQFWHRTQPRLRQALKAARGQ